VVYGKYRLSYRSRRLHGRAWRRLLRKVLTYGTWQWSQRSWSCTRKGLCVEIDPYLLCTSSSAHPYGFLVFIVLALGYRTVISTGRAEAQARGASVTWYTFTNPELTISKCSYGTVLVQRESLPVVDVDQVLHEFCKEPRGQDSISNVLMLLRFSRSVSPLELFVAFEFHGIARLVLLRQIIAYRLTVPTDNRYPSSVFIRRPVDVAVDAKTVCLRQGCIE
jgi:hypothetical protein